VGVVTKVDTSDHGRTILEIDGQPARDVYDTWNGGRTAHVYRRSGSNRGVT
jgi:hypothetical protein